MIRSLIVALLIPFAAAPVDAQQVSVRFDSADVSIGARFGSHDRSRRHRVPRVVTPMPAWRIVREQVWVPGCERVVEIPAQYGFRYDSCGRRIRYCISPARREVIREPGRWEWRERQVPVARPGGRLLPPGPVLRAPDARRIVDRGPIHRGPIHGRPIHRGPVQRQIDHRGPRRR